VRKRPLKLAVLAGGVALAVVPAGLSFAGTTTDASATPSAAVRADSFTGKLNVPSTLVPPPGNVLSSVFTASGVQVYNCVNGAWTFLEPAASLTGLSLTPPRPATALHFRGPSWESDQDGTLVEGTGPVSAPSDTPNSIPQLLLTAKTTRGTGVFGGVTYIQRLATSGGVAPATACTGTETTGVPYRAVYRFFKAKS
jgi:hypothetical protein